MSAVYHALNGSVFTPNHSALLVPVSDKNLTSTEDVEIPPDFLPLITNISSLQLLWQKTWASRPRISSPGEERQTQQGTDQLHDLGNHDIALVLTDFLMGFN